MSSKLAFLSKYENHSRDRSHAPEKKKKTKKKSKHRSKSAHDERRHNHAGAIRDMDDINAFVPGNTDTHYLGEDEGPTVVEGVTLGGETEPSSSATAVAGGRGFETVASAEGSRPPRGVAQQGHEREMVRRKRHDSDSEDSDGSRQGNGRRRRHDSDSSASGGGERHRRNGPSNARRERHDSDSDSNDIPSKNPESRGGRRGDSGVGEGAGSGTGRGKLRNSNGGHSLGKERRRRHDSDVEEDSGEGAKNRGSPRRRHHDSDFEKDNDIRKRDGSRRRYSDSTDSANSHRREKSHRRERNDSNSNDRDRDEKIKQRHQRRRHDSSDDDDSTQQESTSKRARMSSGHKSGLQTSGDFAKAEQKVRKRKREALAQFNAGGAGGGGNGKTVHRDATGKKSSVAATPDTAQPCREHLEQRQANKGAHQKLQEEQRRRELEEASGMALARGVGDARLEARKRAAIREGDPMAREEWAKQQKEGNQHQTSGAAAGSRKLVYKGPQPKPNRYGLRPGYRWDGIDRGNGFEDRVLETLHSKGRKKEEAYKWSCADM